MLREYCSTPFLAAIAVVPLVLGQFVPPPTDLKTAKGYADISIRYKQVPTGICEQNPKVKSFSGYADVADDQHIFWWFFEARNVDPATAPLTVWINGGPGASSMIGLFQENGPCGVDSDGNIFNNPYSWSNVSNMIYIDQPTQTGFSYSIPIPGYTDDEGTIIALPDNSCPDYAASTGTCGTYSYPNITLTANSTAAAAPNLWATLQGFMVFCLSIWGSDSDANCCHRAPFRSTHAMVFTLHRKATVDIMDQCLAST